MSPSRRPSRWSCAPRLTISSVVMTTTRRSVPWIGHMRMPGLSSRNTSKMARSTRATAAVARLNQRSEGRHYLMVMTGDGKFILRERLEGGDKDVAEPLPLDEFVRLVDATGPQKALRMTKNDIAFARQLVR